LISTIDEDGDPVMSDSERREAACHQLLLTLAGRLPDHELRAARRALADGEIRAAAVGALDALAALGALLTAEELAAARELAGDPVSGQRVGTGTPPTPPYRFLAPDSVPDPVRTAADDAVRLLAEASADQVREVDCSVRHGVTPGQRDGGGHRVYLVRTVRPQDAPVVAGTFYDALEAAGCPDAGVEVIAAGSELPEYHRLALAAAHRVWPAPASGGADSFSEQTSPAPEFRIARIYDRVDPVLGPQFAPDHPLLDDPALRADLLTYLAAGRPVLSTTSRTTDPLDPAAGKVVPLGFLTDGQWIWTEAVGYFLDRHGLEPDPELVAHARAAGRVGLAPPSDATLSRAADFLLRPPAEQRRPPAWTSEPGPGLPGS
jgi:hypothetical protein